MIEMDSWQERLESGITPPTTPFEAKILRCSTGDGVKRLNQ
jgi:hypothetical protein